MRQRIKTIKSIKEQHGLSVNQVLDIVAENGGYVSDTTAKKVFREGSENQVFQFQTISALYEALTSEFGEDFANEDIATLKHIISERNRQIDSLLVQIEELHEDFNRRRTFYDERKAQFERTISFMQSQVENLTEQLKSRDASISRKDEILEKLLDATLLKK